MEYPLISIGVPVFNDKLYLKNALDHLVQQDYPNLEIVIADDGSTDGSRAICQEYCIRNKKIRYFENKYNLGALNNHRLVVELSKGDYFAWGSGHDYLHSSFISQTFLFLKDNPSCLMCCPRSVFIDEKEQVVRTPIGGLDTRGFSPADRFEKVLYHLTSGGTANIFYGLYQRKALSHVNISRKAIGFDCILLGELSLQGDIVQIEDILYYRIMHANTVENKRIDRHQNYVFNNYENPFEKYFPYFNMICEYLKMIEESNLSEIEKQAVFKLITMECHRIKPIIDNELNNVINAAGLTLTHYAQYHKLQKYWASRFLELLNQTWILGYEIPGIESVRNKCQHILRIKNRNLIYSWLKRWIN